ncbi:hypothetical protein [Rummeliibacillus pycnus]|uniref:hypothetical protein n=1 Tax=Rummeliibacillus pycnus TaxID=101070 RepID=UPI003D2D97A6
MELKFCIENEEILITPYYNDFFFENIKIFVKTAKYEKNKLFQSALHGKFLLNLGEAIIEILKTGQEQKVKSIGEPHIYEISLQSDTGEIMIKELIKQKVIQKYTYPKEEFLKALANESKHYLQTIKKVNPRIALEDQYQLLASCYVYFDRPPIMDYSIQNL